MKKLFLSFLFFPAVFESQLDFRFDNVAYKTLYAEEFCRFSNNNPSFVLLDVRSPGEFQDTSARTALNIGHLKGAINISIDSLLKSIEPLKKHKNDPIVVYCSHSQRSRRVCKLLTDSGFSEVRNLNGGMTWLNQANIGEFPCKRELMQSNLPYNQLSVNDALSLIKNEKDLLILDVRKASEFNGNDTAYALNIGRIKNAVNIPESSLAKEITKLVKYKNKPILIYDNRGAESSKACQYLAGNGFKKIYQLTSGLQAVIGREKETTSLRKEILTATPAYNLLNAKETCDLIVAGGDLLILDVRTQEEFANKNTQYWKNLGNIKNAINLPYNELSSKISSFENRKNATVLVYGSMAAMCCKQLSEQGFKNVNMLYSGLWDIVSASFNAKECDYFRSILVNHEGLY
jgi:rhodanese-related sulfurtransferase